MSTTFFFILNNLKDSYCCVYVVINVTCEVQKERDTFSCIAQHVIALTTSLRLALW